MTDIQQFNECFKLKGGHFNCQSTVIPEVLESLLNSCRNDLISIQKDRPELPEVYLDFIDNTSLNACVSKMNGRYFIGLNIGTYILLSDLFFRMLSSKNILTEYGDISKENDALKLINAQITDINILFLSKDPDEKIAPKCEIRYHLAHLLTIFAIKFLVIHEYGHIIFGHLDYQNIKTKNCYWNEISYEENEEKLDPLISQTLEMDADCYGVNKGIEMLIHYSENNNGLIDELKYFLSPLESSLSLWLFSIYSMFRLFGFKNKDISKLKTSFHPLTGIRQHIVFITAHTIFQNNQYKELLSKIPELEVSTIKSVEKAFEEISMQEYDIEAIKIAFKKESQEHILLLLRNWNKVRPELEKFATGKLAPLFVE